MFKILCAFILSTGFSTNAYYDDQPEVIALANAGDFSIVKNSSECPRQYGPVNERDELRGERGALCVESLLLPEDVQFEIDLMKQAELENESDYDQRITSVLAFKYHKMKNAQASLEELEKLVNALNIPFAQMKDLSFSSEVASARTFSRFDDLFLGIEFITKAKVRNFLLKSFKGQNLQVVSFGDGVELYPGGGFYVTHYLFISKNQAIYVKLSWWNS